MESEDGVDFSEFNPEAAELDLGIDAAEEVEAAEGVVPGEVTGPV